MFSYLTMVEQRIKKAQQEGEFERLPGAGRPLQLEDEIRQMEDMLATIPDEKEKYRLIKKINYKIMKLNIVRKRSPLLEERQRYYRKVVEKCGEKS